MEAKSKPLAPVTRERSWPFTPPGTNDEGEHCPGWWSTGGEGKQIGTSWACWHRACYVEDRTEAGYEWRACVADLPTVSGCAPTLAEAKRAALRAVREMEGGA